MDKVSNYVRDEKSGSFPLSIVMPQRMVKVKKEKNHEKNIKFIVTGCIPDLWHRSECSIRQHQ
jgi:hypothetical protein